MLVADPRPFPPGAHQAVVRPDPYAPVRIAAASRARLPVLRNAAG